MRVKAYGINYLDDREVIEMTKTEHGKSVLEKMDYRPIKWSTRNTVTDPAITASRVSRRHQDKPDRGFMKNNHEHRTQYKLY